MEGFLIVIYLFAFILSIVMIVKFFKIAKGVKEINRLLFQQSKKDKEKKKKQIRVVERIKEHVDSDKGLMFSFEQVLSETVDRVVLSNIEKNTLPSKQQWEILVNQPTMDVAIKLFPLYLTAIGKHEPYQANSEKLLINNYNTLLQRVDSELIADFLYKELDDSENYEHIVKIINYNQFFYPEKIKGLIENLRLKEAILCLNIKKEFYSYEDLTQMQQIINLLDNLPDTGKIEVVKGGIMSKEKELYICANGHRSKPDSKYCDVCKIDIKGLTLLDYRYIEQFEGKVISLERLFENSGRS